MKPLFDAHGDTRRAAIAAIPREPACQSNFPKPPQFESGLIWRCTLLAVALFVLANIFDGKPANPDARQLHQRVQA
ncbi:hypothetical protein [Burkholderia gladioli]|uniref:hypothetical protein n=1 Tax=Burkholderia gladioli TaxID=28095 RepID=UPI001057086D|nr:hypothetical protein [Burkholderia gladioli]